MIRKEREDRKKREVQMRRDAQLAREDPHAIEQLTTDRISRSIYRRDG
jgi:hypothetical protein